MHNKLILSVGLLAVIATGGLAAITLGVTPVHAADPHTVGSISLNSDSYPVPFSSNYSENEDISQFPLHPFSWTDLPLNSKDRSLAGGDVTVRIAIIDNEYDLSAGNDIIREDVRDLDGDGVPDAGPVKISITRGAEEFLVGYAGGTRSETVNGTSHFGAFTEDDHSTFIAEIEIKYNMGPPSNRCPGPETENSCILQGDVLVVDYLDQVGSQDSTNTVSYKAVFGLFNGVIQTDKSIYDTGEYMIFTIIDPDLDLDHEEPDLVSLDIIGWSSGQHTTTLDNPAFHIEPNNGDTSLVFRETNDSSGVFQAVLVVPSEINGDPLEKGKVTLEYIDWGPATADYVGKTSVTIRSDVHVNIVQPPSSPDTQNVGLVTLTSKTHRTIEASWEAPEDEPDGYQISWHETGEEDREETVSSVIPSYTLDEVDQGVEYGLKVRAQYGDAFGKWSDKSFVTAFNLTTGTPTVVLDRSTYSWTDRVYITVEFSEHNFDDTQIDEIGNIEDYSITVETRGSDIKLYKLVETGLSTGIFTGEVTLIGFEHDVDGDGIFDTPKGHNESGIGPTDGLLESYNDDGFAVVFFNLDGAIAATSSLVHWNIGEIQWLQQTHSATGVGVVRVIDRDMNLDPDVADSFKISVWSDTNAGGITLTVTETGLTTGVFEGAISFSLDDDTGVNVLTVSEGDTVTAEYTDYTLPRPYARTDSIHLSSTALIDVSEKQTEPEETVTDTEPEETVTDTEPEETVTDTEPEETVTDTEPEETVTDTEPEETVTDTEPEETVTDTEPEETVTDTEPEETVTDTEPEETVTDTEPEETVTDTEPEETVTDTEPEETVTDTEPEETVTDTEPEETVTDTEPEETVTDTEPEETVTDTEPEETVTDTEPEETVTDTEPEETVTDTEPEETVTDTEPEETVTDTEPGTQIYEPEPEPEPVCGAGTELVDGICQVVQSNEGSEELLIEDKQDDFNFLTWLFSLFGWS